MSHGVVAAIHLAGVRGEPCGAVRYQLLRNSMFQPITGHHQVSS